MIRASVVVALIASAMFGWCIFNLRNEAASPFIGIAGVILLVGAILNP